MRCKIIKRGIIKRIDDYGFHIEGWQFQPIEMNISDFVPALEVKSPRRRPNFIEIRDAY